MRRRDVIALFAAALARPLATRAQQKAMPVIGFLNGTSAGSDDKFLTAFRRWTG